MGKGTENLFTLSGGFNITGQQPIDSRIVVKNVADLYSADTWDGVGLYNGLVVAIQSTGALFVLKDRDNYTNQASWVAVGGDVSADLSALTGRVDDIEEKLDIAADSGLDATSALKVKIDSTVEGNILQLSENGLSVVASQSEYSLDAVSTPADGFAAQYEFKKDGQVQTTINIPKDQFLKSATFHATAEEGVAVEAPYLKFVWDLDINDDLEGIQNVTYVPVKDLVDTYTAGEFITIDGNSVSVNKSALYTDINNTLIGEMPTRINSNAAAISELQARLDGTGEGEDHVKGIVDNIAEISLVVTSHTRSIKELQEFDESIDARVTTNKTTIDGLVATIGDYKVKNVDTTASHGISLALVDPNSEDDDTNATHVKVNVDLDTLAAAVIAKHDVPAPIAENIAVSAFGTTYTENTNVQAVLESLDSRIKAAVSGGVTSVVAGSGINVVATDANNPTVSVNMAALVAEGSGITVTDNKIDICWTEL